MDIERLSNSQSASPDALDDAFTALRDRDRRYLLYFLLENESASLSEVADVVAAWSHATDGAVVEPQCRNHRYQRLLRVHVPKLVEVGVVSHDEETDRISLAPCPEPIQELAARACAAETGS